MSTFPHFQASSTVLFPKGLWKGMILFYLDIYSSTYTLSFFKLKFLSPSFLPSFFLRWVFVAVRMGFLQLWQAGATLHCGARASHCGGFSCCGARALGCTGFSSCGTQAQQLWHMGLVAPWHVESSWTRDRTCVLCVGRWIINHCTTREVLIHAILTCSSRRSKEALLRENSRKGIASIDFPFKASNS